MARVFHEAAIVSQSDDYCIIQTYLGPQHISGVELAWDRKSRAIFAEWKGVEIFIDEIFIRFHLT